MNTKKNKVQVVERPLPPPYCASICRNALSERCMESCNLKQDMSSLALKPHMDLDQMPRFPIDDFIQRMTPEERKIIAAVYLAKVVDQQKGIIHHEPRIKYPRRNHDRSNGRQVPKTLKIEDLQFVFEEKDTSAADREVTSSAEIRSPGMD